MGTAVMGAGTTRCNRMFKASMWQMCVTDVCGCRMAAGILTPRFACQFRFVHIAQATGRRLPGNTGWLLARKDREMSVMEHP